MGPSAQSTSKNELATCKTLGTYGAAQAAKLLQAQAGAIICARACLALIVPTTTTRVQRVTHTHTTCLAGEYPYVGGPALVLSQPQQVQILGCRTVSGARRVIVLCGY